MIPVTSSTICRLWCHLMMTAGLPLILGCDMLDMYDQPRVEPLEQSHFFADGLSARPAVVGTIPRGKLREDVLFFTGKSGDAYATEIPEEAFRTYYEKNPQKFEGKPDELSSSERRQKLLERGHERFEIYCSVCHGSDGLGNGMIVRRGFIRPPSYHQERLRNAPVGHLFDVATRGLGAMAGFANRIEVQDRWAIVAYIRALQLSQNAAIEDVPEDLRETLKASQIKTDPPRASEGESRE